MKIFNTLLDAAEFAATLCRNWSFATADERYNAEGLLTLAEISDSEDQLTRHMWYRPRPSACVRRRGH